MVKQNDGKDRSSDRQQKLQSNLNLLIEDTLLEELNKEEDLDFSLSNNLVNQKKYETKKIKPHNITKIKSKNFLTNISYNRVKEGDLFDRNFVFDACDDKKH